MKKIICLFCAALLLAACSSPQQDTTTAINNTQAEKNIRAALSDLGEISAIEPSEWDGVFAVTISGQTLYASADGSHFLAGDLYRAEGRVNLTNLKRDDIRKKMLEGLAPEDSIVFSPQGETKFVTWVFTDVDCAYCRKLHKDIAEYNDLGIEVRYLAFPRAGEGSQSWLESQSVWCSEDRKAALTNAKNGAKISVSPDCAAAKAVAHGYAAGQAAGLRGTPMILDAEGHQLGGYLPPRQLLQRLQSSS